MKRIIIDRFSIDNIPMMTIYPEETKNLPLVIFIHGYGNTKESGLEYGFRLAEAGIFFAALDCAMHGGRSDQPLNLRFGPVYPEDTGLDTYLKMHEIVEASGKELETIIHHFKSDDRVDINRLGVTGFSMGAFVTYWAAANLPQVQAAVPIGGKSSFRKGWDDVVLGAETYPQWQASMVSLQHESRQRSQYLASIDPSEKLKEYAPKPLLMINGDRDTDQIYIYALELYKQLKPFYQNTPEQLGLSMPPERHCLSPEIMIEACRWLERYL